MNPSPITVLLHGHDPNLLETRQWVLQSRGYRAVTALKLSTFRSFKAQSPRLLVLCHSLNPREAEAAANLAKELWPEIKTLVLVADCSRRPSGLLGQLLHTAGGPSDFLFKVSSLVGQHSLARQSHIY